MYRFLFTIVFFKKEKQHSQDLSHFENESTFQKRTTFWRLKAHSKTHFENENMLKINIFSLFSGAGVTIADDFFAGPSSSYSQRSRMLEFNIQVWTCPNWFKLVQIGKVEQILKCSLDSILCGLSSKDRGATENPVSDLELNLNKTATKAIEFY